MKNLKKCVTNTMVVSVLLLVMLLGMLTACAAKNSSTDKTTNEGNNALVEEDLKGAVKIGTVNDLLDFAKKVNAGNTTLNAVLTADIDLTSICGEGIGSWEAIGVSGEEVVVWDGIFDGAGHTITGLYSVEEGDDKAVGGLFNLTGENSIIRNLVLKDAVIEEQHGGCLARTSKGLIENCQVSGTVRGLQVGGLASNAHIIKDCTFSGTIEGHEAGGLAWWVDQAVDCRNEARVTCIYEGQVALEGTAAGIVVKAYGDVTGCTNTGTIIGDDAAGIAAFVNYNTDKPQEIKIEDCKNTGTVIGITQAGGIGIYLGRETLVNRCGNEGTLYAGLGAGGIAINSRFQIRNSFQKGVIEVGPEQINQRLTEAGLSEFATVEGKYLGDTLAAGIVCMGNQVINCYSQGSITAQHVRSSYGDALGIMRILVQDVPIVANCYSTAVLNGADDELGIGELYKNEAESCFYSEQTAGQANIDGCPDFPPTAAGSFTDGTVTDALNAWVSSAGGDYSGWIQGTDGPCFEWE